jgi:hypothetical protein
MCIRKKILPLLIIGNLFILNCQSQNVNRSVSSDLSDIVPTQNMAIEGLYVNIPKLEILIEYALKKSALVKQQNSHIQVQESERKSKKYEWLDYIRPLAEIKYGSTDYVYIGSQGQSGVVSGDVMTTTRYSIGARIEMSIFDGVDLSRKEKIEQFKVDIEKGRLEDIEHKIRLDIIRMYNELISSQKILAQKSRYKVDQGANLSMATEQFNKSEISLAELARISQMNKEALDEYEIAYRIFSTTWMLLEEMVGVKLQTLIGR